MRRLLIPVVALLAAGLIGGIGAVAVWEAVDDDGGSEAIPVAARPTAASTPTDVAQIYERAAPGVVEITVSPQTREDDDSVFPQIPDDDDFFRGPQDLLPGRSGSGFVIDEEGRIVTNQHVVGEAENVEVTLANGDEARARVIGTDPSSDLALLQLEDYDGDLTPLELGSSESLEIGDPVVAIGSPFGLQGTLTAGIVSALDRELRAPNGFTIDGAVQTDAALNSGNSGGPLLDAAGRVVGVASQIQSGTGGNVGIGYAVPVETVRSVVDQLREDGEVEHAYLGVQLSEEGDDVTLVEVVDGGPADDAGLRDGDVVVAIDGDQVDSGDDVRDAVGAKQPGDSMEVEVRRGDDTQTFDVELGQRPASVD